MNRIDTIRQRLRQHFEEDVKNVVVFELTAAEWTDPFGWKAPTREPGVGFAFSFSAEVIDKNTAHLDDATLGNYLMAVAFLCDVQITNTALEEDERRRVAERALYDIAPGSLSLVSDVDARALDAR